MKPLAAASGDALDVLCAGEALWDLTPPPGRSLANAPSLRFQPGGAAVNAALLLARIGFRTGLAAVVGDDALGEALATRVAARGVSTALVGRAPPRTGLCFVEEAGRSTRVVGYRPPSEHAPNLNAPFSWRARVLLLTGVTPSAEQAASFGAAAAEARRRRTLVVVDLNARPRMWQGAAPAAAPAWLREADVVKASDEDLAAMGLEEAALRAGMRADAVLVVTAGARPARALGRFGEVGAAPRRVAAGRALGAGDAFTVGVLDTLLRAGAREAVQDAALWELALRRGHALARRRVTGAPARARS